MLYTCGLMPARRPSRGDEHLSSPGLPPHLEGLATVGVVSDAIHWLDLAGKGGRCSVSWWRMEMGPGRPSARREPALHIGEPEGN